MKPYGIDPHYPIAPDCADIATYGLKSSLSQIRGKGGEIHNSFHDPNVKARVRRYWKRVARAEGKAICRKGEE